MVCAYGIHRFKNKIISLRLSKNAVFRVITELTENLVGFMTIIGYLLSEQFSTHLNVLSHGQF